MKTKKIDKLDAGPAPSLFRNQLLWQVPRAALDRRSGCMGQNRYRFAGLRSQT